MAQEINIEKSQNANPLQVSDAAPPNKMTYEEFLDWLDEGRWAEWIAGEIILMTAPNTKHQQISRFLVSLTQCWVEAKDLGEVFPAPFQMKLETQSTGRMPDLLFVARKNHKKLKKNYLDGAADLVVEVISPESRKRDRNDKFYEYEEAGIREYWMIDPTLKRTEFYVLGEDKVYRPVSLDENGIFRSTVIKGLWLKVDWLWQEPLPTLMSVLKEWKLI
jgi:Uma2 family endonuclease